LQHAQGGLQADAAGAGDLQALFDTSALVLGITLVAPDPQVLTGQHFEFGSPKAIHHRPSNCCGTVTSPLRQQRAT
jgi:hypothetical protein